MWELLRAKARAAMEREGVRQIDRPGRSFHGVVAATVSFFALYWREYAGRPVCRT